MEAAHIIPFDEGGPDTADNMRCLCQRRMRSLTRGARRNEIGCHVAFDKYHVWKRAELEAANPYGVLDAANERLLGARERWEGRSTDSVETHLINRHWMAAIREVKALPEGERAHRLPAVVVALRKRKGAAEARWRAIREGIDRLAEQYAMSEQETRSRIEYEYGMVLFQTRRFEESASWLERAPFGEQGRGWIGHVQAQFARFEHARRIGNDLSPFPHQVGHILRARFGAEPGHFTNTRALDSFVVDSHLHLARMHAGAGEAQVAERMLTHAEWLRHHRIAEPSLSRAIQQIRGEVALANEELDEARIQIARSGALICRHGGKDYEQLENVLALLERCELASQLQGELARIKELTQGHIQWLQNVRIPDLLRAS